MSCCTPTIQVFTNEAITTVPYIGERPTVQVIYLQDDGTFIQMGVFTQINIIGTDVVFDHGGLASGLVKLLQ